MPTSITEATSSILPTISKYFHDQENEMLIYLLSQDESSETFIGEWAEARGIRDQLFIATKVNILPDTKATCP